MRISIQFKQVLLSGILTVVVPLTPHLAQASICLDAAEGVPAKYASWFNVETQRGLPKDDFHYEGLLKKRAFFLTVDADNFDKEETIEGQIVSVPHPNAGERHYVVQVEGGIQKTIDRSIVKVIRVDLPVNDTLDGFETEYGAWYKVELSRFGIPRYEIEHSALLEKEVAIFSENPWDFDRKEIVRGKIIDSPGETSLYRVRLANGTVREIKSYHVKGFRLLLHKSNMTRAEFDATYGSWHEVLLKRDAGHPRDPRDLGALLGKKAAFYIKDQFNFNWEGQLIGKVTKVPDHENFNYEIEAEDGHLVKIRPMSLQALRVFLGPSVTHEAYLAKYSHWRKVELNYHLPARNNLVDKHAAIFIVDKSDFNQSSVVEGVILRYPFLAMDEHSYDVRLGDNSVVKISTSDVSEIRVNVVETGLSLEAFTSQFSSWRNVELDRVYGLPVHANESRALVHKEVAIYLEDASDFDRKEIVRGTVTEVPVYGTEKDHYKIELENGEEREIQASSVIRALRVHLN